MKKILMLTAFALAGLASAQTTAPMSAPMTSPVTAPATTDAPAMDAPATDATTPAATNNMAPAPVTAPASTDTAAPAPSTGTGTSTSTSTPDAAPMSSGMAMPSTMAPADNFSKSQEYAVQADVAYPVPFYDRTLWKAAVDHSYYAAKGEASNRDYNAYLAQLYTKTQWWINAYSAWNNLGDLNATEKQWASLSAAKLAYLALQRGDKAAASAYVSKGMSWADSPSLQAIKKRL